MTEKHSLVDDVLDHIVNEDTDKAAQALHQFIVEKARQIHETLIEEDELDNDVDEEITEEETAEADEEQVEEAKDETNEEEEEVDESVRNDRHEVRSDEYFGREELTTEDEGEEGDEMAADELEGGEGESEMDGEEMAGEEEDEVTLDRDDVEDLRDCLADLEARFADLMGEESEEGEEGEEAGEMDMDMDMGDEGDMEESFVEEAADVEESEESEDDDLEEAVSHDPGVQKEHGVDPEGKHSRTDSVKHNEDAKLPESAEFDFDLTEEDFVDLEEGLKAVDVKMGGEQGGVKFAGEETQTASPVAQKDKSDVNADPKTMPSKQKEHGDFDLESAPSNDSLPHSGDNSHDSADMTGSPKRSEVNDAGGLEAQDAHNRGKGKAGAGEVGSGSYSKPESNVKSPLGSAGTRTEK